MFEIEFRYSYGFGISTFLIMIPYHFRFTQDMLPYWYNQMIGHKLGRTFQVRVFYKGYGNNDGGGGHFDEGGDQYVSLVMTGHKKTNFYHPHHSPNNDHRNHDHHHDHHHGYHHDHHDKYPPAWH